MKVWTGHIKEAIQHSKWNDIVPKLRFLGVFESELEAANKVREARVAGFDAEGWVSEWDVKSAQSIYRVMVFDKQWVSS